MIPSQCSFSVDMLESTSRAPTHWMSGLGKVKCFSSRSFSFLTHDDSSKNP